MRVPFATVAGAAAPGQLVSRTRCRAGTPREDLEILGLRLISVMQ